MPVLPDNEFFLKVGVTGSVRLEELFFCRWTLSAKQRQSTLLQNPLRQRESAVSRPPPCLLHAWSNDGWHGTAHTAQGMAQGAWRRMRRHKEVLAWTRMQLGIQPMSQLRLAVRLRIIDTRRKKSITACKHPWLVGELSQKHLSDEKHHSYWGTLF